MSNGRTPLFLSAIVLLMLSGLVISNQPDSSFEPSAHVLALERDGRITLRASDARLLDVARELARVSGVDIQLDDRLDDVRVDLNLMDADFNDVLTAISGSHAQILEKRDDDYAVTAVLITAEVDDVPVAMELHEPEEPVLARVPMGVLSNTDEPRHRVLARDRNVILLQNAVIDTDIAADTGVSVEVPDAFRAPEDTEFHIVQFDGRIGEGQREALQEAGAVISHYVPNSAFAIRIKADQLDKVRGVDGVRHIEPYHPYYKMSDDLLAYKSETATQEEVERARLGSYRIMLFGGADAEEFVPPDSVQVVRMRAVGDRHIITVDCDPKYVNDLLAQDVVQWVVPNIQPTLMNDLASERIRAGALKTMVPGLDGSGVIVSITDSGLDFLNPGFAIDPTLPISLTENTRVVHYAVRESTLDGSTGEPGDLNGHGTHVAGSVLGGGALSHTVISAPGSGSAPYGASQFAGIAPRAQAVIIEDFRSFDDDEQAEVAYTHGARISNNSWGAAIFQYSDLSYEWDIAVRDAVPGTTGNQELTVFFSAGNSGQGNNDGTGGVPGTIGSPGNAKNVITVGAVEQLRRANNLPNATAETDTDWQMAFFSSRGPVTASDLRTKPDIVAPGAYVLSVQSRDTMPDDLSITELPMRDYRAGNVNSGTNFAFFSGTSMSSPVAAGAGALFHQYYQDLHDRTPSPALTKAALVGGARMLNSLMYNYPNQPWNLERSDQGWGMLDISRSVLGSLIHPTDRVIMLDQHQISPIGTDESFTTEITVAPGEGNLKVVLAWTDAPGSPGNAPQLVNDIDLLVHAPQGGGYLGNFYGRDRVHSEYFDEIDVRYGDAFNNVEIVTIKNARPGTYTIEVYGWEVIDGPQDFALFIMTGTGIEGRMRGKQPSMTLGSDTFPVVAYSDYDFQGYEQIYVRRWHGEVGDRSQLGQWTRMEDQWFSIAGTVTPGISSAEAQGVSVSYEPSRNPAVAVHGDHVYVAWEHHGVGATNIYVRHFDGTTWNGAATRVEGLGVSGFNGLQASQPRIAINGQGRPVILWLQTHADGGQRAHVARWNGSTWTGYGTSKSSGVGGLFFVEQATMTINSAGNPAVAFLEVLETMTSPASLRIRTYQSNGGTGWANLGTQGSAPIASQPNLAAGPSGQLFLTWIQAPSGVHPQVYHQVYAARWDGSNWRSMDGSRTYPGLSGRTLDDPDFAAVTEPSSPQISYTHTPSPKVTVSWVAGEDEDSTVLVREYNFASWSGVSGAGVPPGIGATGYDNSYLNLATHGDAIPVLAFQHDSPGGPEVQVYTVVRDFMPPFFAGLRTATGGNNQNVFLRWNPAVDRFSTNFYYSIYRSATTVPCWQTPSCNPEDVFQNGILVAVETNGTQYEVTGLTNYELYCFGVRVSDGEMSDDNIVTRYAGPEEPGLSCEDRVDPITGLPIWWLELFFPGGLTSNEAHNVVFGPPGALTPVLAHEYGTDPFSSDSDGDGITDWDEVHGWVTASGVSVITDPANPDTSGDGLPDGMTGDYVGWDPTRWDSAVVGVMDGMAFELGLEPGDAGYEVLLQDNFDPAPVAGWTLSSPSQFRPWNFWHVSSAEPAPRTGAATNWTRMNDRSGTNAWRMAIDPTGANVNADYDNGTFLLAALDAPTFDDNVGSTGNLTLRWRDYYDTEPNRDFVSVQARSDQKQNWRVVSSQRSGRSIDNDWYVNHADLSEFAGDTGIRIRYLFEADNINNHFGGWYIDEVTVYRGAEIRGWVRDIWGRPVLGAEVMVMGAGGAITNIVDGHQAVRPAASVGSARTTADGFYRISALPFGQYRVKARAAQYRSEFYNGELFDYTGNYAFGAGIGYNRGVPNVLDANDGVIELSLATPSYDTAFFELELGESRTHLGVAHPDGPKNALLNYAANRIWNGVADPATATFLAYQTVANLADLVDPRPQWDTNQVIAPVFYGELAPGVHRVSVEDEDIWYMPQVRVPVREGEYTRVNLRAADSVQLGDPSELGRGFLEVVAPASGLPIYLNGVRTPYVTPATFLVQAGTHVVQLVPNHTDRRTAPMDVHVKLGRLTTAAFTADQISGQTGRLLVTTRDAFGNTVAGAQIFVNGLLQPGTSPATITGLRKGMHEVSVRMNGFRDSITRQINVLPGADSPIQFGLFQSDEDYDGVGDYTEIIGYTNIFLYAADDDPDGDDMTNQMEFDMFRYYGVLLNPFNPDTDGDGMTDGEEVGYNGHLFELMPDGRRHVMYARSKLVEPLISGATSVVFEFRGRYLEGINNFGDTNDNRFVASVDGDRFVATQMIHPPVVFAADSAYTMLSGIATQHIEYLYVSQILDRSHLAGVPVYGDTAPDVKDTSGDGMWDGFKSQFEFMYPELNCTTNVIPDPVQIHILSPIERGGRDEDPDHDGLTNYQEFLGPDGVPNPENWTDPGNPDTDCDGMPDGFEYYYGLDPNDPSDAWEDPDEDGLMNVEEYYYGTHPFVADTDGDGLLDGEEVFGTRNPYKDDAFFPEFPGSTDPTNPDTDGDGLLDGEEVFIYGTNPNRWDTLGEGMSDGFAVLDPFGNPRPPDQWLLFPGAAAADSSGDGMSNLDNFLVRDGQPPGVPVWDYWLDPFSTDSDGDGMPDVFEVYYGLHPMDPLPVEGGTLLRYPAYSAKGDLDMDGLWNLREYEIRFLLDPNADPFEMPGKSTDPRNPDTDGDGLYDGEEWHALLSDPTNIDTSGDGMPDGSGIPGRFGKVRTTEGPIYYIVPAPNGPISWAQAEMYAQTIVHPRFTNATARLAAIRDEHEYAVIRNYISTYYPLAMNIAIGAWGEAGVEFSPYQWVSGDPFYDYFTETPSRRRARAIYYPGDHTNMFVDVPFAEDQGLLFSIMNPLEWFPVPITSEVVEYVLVEWRNPDEQHYDQSLNDLWQLVWPARCGDRYDLPFWRRIDVGDFLPGFVDEDLELEDPPDPEEGEDPEKDEVDDRLPPPRWGHTMTYVPTFEKKVLRDNEHPTRGDGSPDDEVILLDNRKLVVIGGRDGVDRHRDIWEFWIHLGEWRKSSQTMSDANDAANWETGYASGLSEHSAVLLMGYSQTGDGAKDDGSPDIRTFHPKGRPWDNGYQRSGYDLTYVFGGWNYQRQYMGRNPLDAIAYKSTDDPRHITETLGVEEDGAGVAEFEDWDRSTDPDPEDYYGASRLEEPPRFAIGRGNLAARAPSPPSGPGISDVRPLTGYSALNIAEFALWESTDEVLHAELYLQMWRTTGSDMDIRLYASLNNDPDYNSIPDGDEPRFRNPDTDIFDYVIPAGEVDVVLDVTELVQQILEAGHDGDRLSLIFEAEDAAPGQYVLVRTRNCSITVTFVPGYKRNARWHGGGTYQQTGITPEKRKSAGLVYDDAANLIVLFGGMDGVQVFDETYHGEPRFSGNFNMQGFSQVRWERIEPSVRPPARWGHSMVFDQGNQRVLLFGGFDRRNRPLGDFWEYRTSTRQWQQITAFSDSERPAPRGGASMIYYGQAFYDRGDDDYRYGSRGRVVLFGGTDGRRYFNDTWVFDPNHNNEVIQTPVRNRWILADPGGELSHGPSPRAFAPMVFAQNAGAIPDMRGASPFMRLPTRLKPATSSAFLFGGRTGTLPTSRDTDQDLVDDAYEHGIGGPDAGRDPRVNAFMDRDNTGEIPPFTYLRIGAYPGLLPTNRATIADFEVMSYNERIGAWRLAFQRLVFPLGTPWQGHPVETTLDEQTYVLGYENPLLPPFEEANEDRYVYNMGVDALSPDWINLWYHRARTSGKRDDPKNAWRLGRPDNTSIGPGAPPTAHKGRWVYGTDLRGPYPHNATMDLFSPIMNLSIGTPQSTDPSHVGPWYLIFHEWLDLASDGIDHVRIDAIRPTTPADVRTRVTGQDKSTVTLLGARNYAYNTTGEWRRVVVPLAPVGNENQVYLRFSLTSDGEQNAGGWYIDHVAVVQGGELEGTYPGALDGTRIFLLGAIDGVVVDSTVTYGDGQFGFGLLPAGNYVIQASDSFPTNIMVGPAGWNVDEIELDENPAAMSAFSISSIVPSSATIRWEAIPGRRYRVQYTDHLDNNPVWHDLTTITANRFDSEYVDMNMTDMIRIYRVIQLPE